MGWIKDSAGNPSATLTLMFAGFVIVSLCVVLPMFNGMVIDGYTLVIQKPDNTLLIALLAAVFPSYVVRRNNADNNNNGTPDEEEVNVEGK